MARKTQAPLTGHGARIEERRIELGLPMQRLAELAGIEYRSLYKLMHETKSPGADMLYKVAGPLRCTVEELLTGQGFALPQKEAAMLAKYSALPEETKKQVHALLDKPEDVYLLYSSDDVELIRHYRRLNPAARIFAKRHVAALADYVETQRNDTKKVAIGYAAYVSGATDVSKEAKEDAENWLEEHLPSRD